VTWKEGKLTESIDLVTHIVSLGPGSDRNGGAAAAAGSPNAQNGGLVRPDGTPPMGTPKPGPNGGMVDVDGTPLTSPQQQMLGNPGLNPMPMGGVRPILPTLKGIK
jgi:general secretion pathway protein I